MENYGFSYNQTLARFEKQPLPIQKPDNYDLLVEVLAVSVNPVDLKLAQISPKGRILGFDAVGIVKEIGEKVTDFKSGQRVFYAGTTKRSGSNQAMQLVDSRIVAAAPMGLTDGQAAAMPLTSLTAWELLFEQMNALATEKGNSGEVLLVNGSGGVGSVAAQLASWAGFEVTATASPKNFDWLRQNQVKHYVDYHQEIVKQTGVNRYDKVMSFYDITTYFSEIAQITKPFGQIGTIVATSEDIPMNLIKNRNINFFWEYMFAKTDFNYQVASQGAILRKITGLIDGNLLQSTLTKELTGGINETNLQLAYKLVKNGHPGKVVISGGFK